MSTTYHTAISTGAAANAATFNSPLGQLDAAVAAVAATAAASSTALGNTNGMTTTNKIVANAVNELNAKIEGLNGGSDVSANQLLAWVESESYQLTALTYHGTYTNVVASATVLWPDGSGGTFTATTINSTWEAIDAYTITHSLSSKTVTQAAVTRNSDGNVTVKPSLSVA